MENDEDIDFKIPAWLTKDHIYLGCLFLMVLMLIFMLIKVSLAYNDLLDLYIICESSKNATTLWGVY